MKPLLVILLLTLGITAVEWTVYELVFNNKTTDEKLLPARPEHPANMPVSVNIKEQLAEKLLANRPAKLFISREREKARQHFDGRTSWKNKQPETILQ